MAGNIFSSQTRDNLIDSVYLHSSGRNFLNHFIGIENSDQRIDYIKNTKKLYNRINQKIAVARAIENYFYEDFGVANAREFSEKYLLFGTNENNISDKPLNIKILYLMQKYEFISLLRRKMDYKGTLENINKDVQNGITINLEQVLNKDSFRSELTKAINQEIQSGIRDVSIKGSKFKVQNEVLNKYLRDTSALPKKVLQLNSEGRSAFIEKIINRNIAFLATDIEAQINYLFAEYLDSTSFKIGAAEKIGISKNDLDGIVKPKIKEMLINDFNKGSKATAFFHPSPQIGFVGEYGLAATVDFAVRVTGGDLNEKGKQGKTDLVFIGKSGKEYSLQAKNSFDDMFNNLKEASAYSARFNEGGKLKNLLDEIVRKGIISEFDAKELEYGMLNLEFLSKFNYDDKSEIQKNTADQTQRFISRLLINSLLYFFGADNSDPTKHKGRQFSFVILANRYLVPYSFFLEAVRDGVNSIYEQAILEIKKPQININGISKEMAKNLYEQKGSIISTLPKGYFYPQELLDVGAKAGQNLLEGASINGIHITFNIDALQKKFLEMVVKGGK